jgi:hypothetical protein
MTEGEWGASTVDEIAQRTLVTVVFVGGPLNNRQGALYAYEKTFEIEGRNYVGDSRFASVETIETKIGLYVWNERTDKPKRFEWRGWQ